MANARSSLSQWRLNCVGTKLYSPASRTIPLALRYGINRLNGGNLKKGSYAAEPCITYRSRLCFQTFIVLLWISFLPISVDIAFWGFFVINCVTIESWLQLFLTATLTDIDVSDCSLESSTCTLVNLDPHIYLQKLSSFYNCQTLTE